MMEKLLTVTLQWKDFKTALTKLAWDIKTKVEGVQREGNKTKKTTGKSSSFKDCGN